MRAQHRSSSVYWTVFISLPGLSLGGCGANKAPFTTSRDSLGIKVVESTAPRWTATIAWHIEDVPALDLVETGTGQMHSFFQVRDVMRLTTDRVLVVDGASREMRVFDSRGRFVHAFGGAGDGPGEFRIFPMVVPMHAGGFVARDYTSGGQGAEFSLREGLIGTFLQPTGVRPLRQVVRAKHLWVDAGILRGEARTSSSLWRPLLAVGRLSDDLASVDTVTVVPWDEVFVTPVADVIPLMGRRTFVVPNRDGDLVVGTAEALEYRKIDGETGEVRSIVRIDGIDLEVSRGDVESERRARLAWTRSPVVREIFADMPFPKKKPAYQRLIADDAGNIWAGEFLGAARRDESQAWYVWDATVHGSGL